MAKDSLFGNIFDVDADTQSSREKSALSLAQLTPGRVQVAGSGMAGSMLGGGVMEGLGYQNPEQQKQQAINEVWQEVGHLDLDDDNNRKIVGNAFIAKNLPDIGMDILQYDDKTTSTKDKKGTHEKRLDTAASLTPCVAASGGDWRLASRECQIEVEVKANELKNEDPNIGIGAKLVGDRLPYYTDLADLARADIRQIREMERILNKGIYTGVGGEAFLIAGKFFGQDVADKELFASLSKDRALAYTEKTKGAISDKEMDLFLSAATSLSKSEGGNRLLLKYSKLFSQQVIKLKAFVMNWRIKNPRLGLASLEVAADKWRNDPANELGLATDPKFIEFADAGAITRVDSEYSENKRKLELLKQVQ